MITDSSEFLRRLLTAIRKEGLEFRHGFVHHYDEFEDNCDIAELWLQDMGNIVFWKRAYYRYQQEYRILVFNNDANNDHKVVQIGDVSGISEILETKDALNLSFFAHD